MLDLSNAAVGDADCDAIAAKIHSSTLEVIKLSGADVSSRGIATVADALATDTSVKSLNLRGCKIGGSGGGIQRIAAALQTNTTLERLDLGDTDLDVDAIAQLRIVLSAPGGNTTLTDLNIDRPLRGPLTRPLLDDMEDDVIAAHVADLLRRNRCAFTEPTCVALVNPLQYNRHFRNATSTW